MKVEMKETVNSKAICSYEGEELSNEEIGKLLKVFKNTVDKTELYKYTIYIKF